MFSTKFLPIFSLHKAVGRRVIYTTNGGGIGGIGNSGNSADDVWSKLMTGSKAWADPQLRSYVDELKSLIEKDTMKPNKKRTALPKSDVVKNKTSVDEEKWSTKLPSKLRNMKGPLVSLGRAVEPNDPARAYSCGQAFIHRRLGYRGVILYDMNPWVSGYDDHDDGHPMCGGFYYNAITDEGDAGRVPRPRVAGNFWMSENGSGRAEKFGTHVEEVSTAVSPFDLVSHDDVLPLSVEDEDKDRPFVDHEHYDMFVMTATEAAKEVENARLDRRPAPPACEPHLLPMRKGFVGVFGGRSGRGAMVAEDGSTQLSKDNTRVVGVGRPDSGGDVRVTVTSFYSPVFSPCGSYSERFDHMWRVDYVVDGVANGCVVRARRYAVRRGASNGGGMVCQHEFFEEVGESNRIYSGGLEPEEGVSAASTVAFKHAVVVRSDEDGGVDPGTLFTEFEVSDGRGSVSVVPAPPIKLRHFNREKNQEKLWPRNPSEDY